MHKMDFSSRKKISTGRDPVLCWCLQCLPVALAMDQLILGYRTPYNSMNLRFHYYPGSFLPSFLVAKCYLGYKWFKVKCKRRNFALSSSSENNHLDNLCLCLACVWWLYFREKTFLAVKLVQWMVCRAAWFQGFPGYSYSRAALAHRKAVATPYLSFLPFYLMISP